MENYDNIKKYENYKILKSKLKKALSNEFYFEAVLIEYAIFEDRAESAFRHAGVKFIDSKGRPLSLARKLEKMRTAQGFSDKFIRERLTDALIDEIRAWMDSRNGLVHSLMKKEYNADDICECAEKGNELLKVFDNKVKSVNNYNDKLNHK